MFDVQPTADVLVNFGSYVQNGKTQTLRVSIGMLSVIVERVESNGHMPFIPRLVALMLQQHEICQVDMGRSIAGRTTNDMVKKGRRWKDFAKWVTEWQDTATQMREALSDPRPPEVMIKIHIPQKGARPESSLTLPWAELIRVVEHFQDRKRYSWREAQDAGVLQIWRALLHANILRLHWSGGEKRYIDAYSFIVEGAPMWGEFVDGLRGIQALAEAQVERVQADASCAAPPIQLTLGAIPELPPMSFLEDKWFAAATVDDQW